MPVDFGHGAVGGRPPSPDEYNAVKEILESVGSIEPLDKTEEVPLIRKAQNGDQESLHTLIKAYIQLALRIASQYGPATIPLQDRLQDGIEGIIDAVKRYDDPTGNTPLFAFAKWRILMHVQKQERAFRESPLSEPLEETTPSEFMPDDAVLGEILSSKEQGALERIINAYFLPHEKTALTLKYLRRPAVSNEFLADVLDVDIKKIPQLLSDVKEKLRTYWVPTSEEPYTLTNKNSPEPKYGNAVTVQISQIKIGDRVRKDLGSISELAENIAQLGLLQPIVITEDGWLVAGYRRLEAIKLLGWKQVPVAIVPWRREPIA